MPLKPIRVPNFQGGLDKSDDSIIADNQLADATNCFYNSDKNLQTRYGQAAFGSPVPDSVLLVDECDATTGWSVSEDGVNLTLDTTNQKRGTGALNFDVDVSATANDYAILTKSTLALDITNQKGSLKFWFTIPTGGLTDFTNIVVRFGTDSSNYYEWTVLAADLVEGSNFLDLSYSDATTTGTLNDASITYFQSTLNYDAAYTDQTDFLIDSIYSYSATSTKGMRSIMFFETTEVPAVRYLFTTVGTGLYLYNETSNSWEIIRNDLTENAFTELTAYKNTMYFTNGKDNYFSFDGVSYTDHTGANTYKGKYFLLANDVGYIAGDPTVPSSLAYTNATPTNLQTFPNVLVVDEDDSSGPITGLINLGPIVIVCKRDKIYKVNVATPSREQIDYSDGFLSHRGLVRVENEVLGVNNSGIYSLAQRQATTGSIRADALSDNVKQIIDLITDKSVVNAIYVDKLKNVYFFVDTSGSGIPDSALVFSILTRGWTLYNNTPFWQTVIYRDSDGQERFLAANALNGQCKELETGETDSTNAISTDIRTKNFVIGVPETLKT